MPDATILADFMTARAAGLVRGLVVHAGRMRANLDRTGGLYFSEAVLLGLVRSGLARQTAYAHVQRAALAALDGKGAFRDLLAADPDVARRLPGAALDACFDLDHHLRHAPAIVARALEAAP
jgi:adenylosuccinate lyase